MPSAVELPSCEKLTMTLRNVLSMWAESEGENAWTQILTVQGSKWCYIIRALWVVEARCWKSVQKEKVTFNWTDLEDIESELTNLRIYLEMIGHV